MGVVVELPAERADAVGLVHHAGRLNAAASASAGSSKRKEVVHLCAVPTVQGGVSPALLGTGCRGTDATAGMTPDGIPRRQATWPYSYLTTGRDVGADDDPLADDLGTRPSAPGRSSWGDSDVYRTGSRNLRCA